MTTASSRNAAHLRFIGGTVYCPVAKHRVQTGAAYGQPFTCPRCGFAWRPTETPRGAA